MNRRDFNKHLLGSLIGGVTLSPLFGGQFHGVGVLDELESMTWEYARRSRLVPPAIPIRHAHIHIDTFKLLLGAAPIAHDRRIYSLAGEAALLVGRLAQLLDSWGESHAYLTWALALAEEAGDSTLRAHALGAISALHSGIPRGGHGGDIAKVISMLDAAITAAGQQAHPYLLSWLHARRAEEHAAAGRQYEAYSDLDSAARVLAAATHPDTAFFSHVDAAWLAGYRRSCARLLGDSDGAVEALEHALRTMTPERLGHRSGVLADMAAAYALKREIDEACRLLSESLALADAGGVTVAVERVRGIRQRDLTQWPDVLSVQELDERLAALPAVS